MKEEDLNDVIRILEQNSSEDDAYFEFTYQNEDCFHIKSNKDGVIVFVKELMYSLENFEESLKEPNKTISIKTSDWFVNDDVFAPFIQPIYKKRSDIKLPKTYKETWKDRLVGFGCGLIIIISVISVFIGIVTIFNWIF